jgi:hypothetical protein
VTGGSTPPGASPEERSTQEDLQREPVKPTRLSVNVSRETVDALHEIAHEKQISITEAVRRLIGYGIVTYRANRDGHEVLIRRDNKLERIVILD